MDKLLLCPTDAYSVIGPADETLRDKLGGGAGRYRADVIGGSSTVNVTFSLRADMAQYLGAFYRAKTGHGSEPFLIDLVLDGERNERTAHFLPGTMQTTEKFKAQWFTVTAQLEVDALEEDSALDNSIADVWEATHGVDQQGYLNLFNIIVNINWPEA